jgi:hypothetical protein
MPALFFRLLRLDAIRPTGVESPARSISFIANDEVASPTLLARGRSRSLAVSTIESIDATRGVN